MPKVLEKGNLSGPWASGCCGPAGCPAKICRSTQRSIKLAYALSLVSDTEIDAGGALLARLRPEAAPEAGQSATYSSALLETVERSDPAEHD